MAFLSAEATSDPTSGLAWSAYDPLAESIESDDPLGFGGAVLHLADVLVPGLSVTTTRLRYYAMVCGGLDLIDRQEPRSDEPRRRELFLRWEKLWALGQPGGRSVLGVRGVDRFWATHSGGAAPLDHRFRLLSNQAAGGALGAYKPSCEALGLVERGELKTTPLGTELAAAFWGSLTQPGRARRACWSSIRAGREDPKSASTVAWMRKAVGLLGLEHTSPGERRILADVLVRDTRWTTLAMAAEGLTASPVDLHGLQAIKRRRPATEPERSCYEAAIAALALDGFICQANFVLDRLVDTAADRPLSIERFVAGEAKWPAMEKRVSAAARRTASSLHGHPELTKAAAWCATVASLRGPQLARALVDRHIEVMQARRARRWLSLDAGKVLAERYPQHVSAPEKIRHSYRLGPLTALAHEAGCA